MDLNKISKDYIKTCQASYIFPDIEEADADGLLAYGGDLTSARLISAYSRGIFPWYNEEPILWFSPDPRMVLYPAELHISRSLKTALRKKDYQFKISGDFSSVIENCASVRKDEGTWINEDMIEAYKLLHKKNGALSGEIWQSGQLTGGVYGVLLGNVFFGESMFFHKANASKMAFVHLVQFLAKQRVALIDCQMQTDNLARFGARTIGRKLFLQQINNLVFV